LPGIVPKAEVVLAPVPHETRERAIREALDFPGYAAVVVFESKIHPLLFAVVPISAVTKLM
jgi:hypothetical protein